MLGKKGGLVDKLEVMRPLCFFVTRWLFFIWFCIFCVFTFLMRPLCSLVTNWLGTSLTKFFVNTIFVIKPLIAKAFGTVKLIVIMIYYNCFGTPIRSVGRFVWIYLRIWGFEIVYFQEYPCWLLHFVNLLCVCIFVFCEFWVFCVFWGASPPVE